MNGIVVDASVAAGWLLGDEASGLAKRVFARMEAGARILVPAVWVLEIANVMFKAERQRRINKLTRDAALDRLERLPVTVVAAAGIADLRTLRDLAEKHQLSAYDAEYLRVSMEMKLPLATLDGNLIAAARKEKVQLVGG